MADSIDNFVIASSALWAGDFEQFEQSLKAFQEEWKADRHAEAGIAYSQKLLIAEANRRLKQVGKRRIEFEKIVGGTETTLVSVPLIIIGHHLRGTVWRRGEREFQLQAYLTDLAYQQPLLKRSKEVAEYSRHNTTDSESGLTSPPQNFANYEPLGASWIIITQMYMEVETTDLGLIEARGIWIRPEFPENVNMVIEPFLTLLAELDTPRSSEPDGQ